MTTFLLREVAAVWEDGYSRHRDGMAGVCQRLARSGSLRKGLAVEDAIATALALTAVETYEELVRHQGWSHGRYEAWLAAALRHALLATC